MTTGARVAEWTIGSEVGQLDAVLLHRPGLELHRITPANMDELLFDELLWVDHAGEEHDAFAGLLRDQGVEVLYLEDLLAEVLADPGLRAIVIARHASDRTCGPSAGPRVRGFLGDLDAAGLVEHLIGGVSVDDVGPGPGLVTAVAPPGAMLLDPLPNTVFMRDSSAWIGSGVVLSPMSRLVRRRESDLLRLVVTRHLRFAGSPVWFGQDDIEHFPATFEGGDLLVVGERGLAIGISERTTAAGVEALAHALFAAGVVDRILAVDMPKVRAAMHLDTIVTQVDVDAFVTYPSMTPHLNCHQVTLAGSSLRVQPAGGLLDGLAWAAGLDHVRAIEPALGSTDAQREQWNDANNTLALRPGVVIAYERNVATNQILEAAGITVHTIPSFELPRGRGGPRCMSCPLRRRPVA
jgi:arginine deiminase